MPSLLLEELGLKATNKGIKGYKSISVDKSLSTLDAQNQ